MGNAAFGMVGMDFETAVRENIPILVVLVNNSVLGGYIRENPVATNVSISPVRPGNTVKLPRLSAATLKK